MEQSSQPQSEMRCEPPTVTCSEPQRVTNTASVSAPELVQHRGPSKAGRRDDRAIDRWLMH
jgi:hypothetical protein